MIPLDRLQAPFRDDLSPAITGRWHSPPSLLTTAACGGLRSTPDCRPRRTFLHLSYSYATSAGLGEFNIPLGAITEANFDNTFNVNVRGTLFTVQKALPLMRDGGSVIMTGSIASAKGFPGLSVYNASKAAIRSFARTWTVDLKDRHIRVNVISPGTIDTGIFVGVPKEVKDQFVSIIPMGRIGQPHEIAAAALFLASDDSSFVTGIELFVDGGTAQI